MYRRNWQKRNKKQKKWPIACQSVITCECARKELVHIRRRAYETEDEDHSVMRNVYPIRKRWWWTCDVTKRPEQLPWKRQMVLLFLGTFTCASPSPQKETAGGENNTRHNFLPIRVHLSRNGYLPSQLFWRRENENRLHSRDITWITVGQSKQRGEGNHLVIPQLDSRQQMLCIKMWIKRIAGRCVSAPPLNVIFHNRKTFFIYLFFFVSPLFLTCR